MEFTKKDLNKTLWVKPTYLENNRKWYVIDVEWKVLWKVAAEIANKLIGKGKAHYNDFWDCWDFVVVTNAKKIKVTGNKLSQKMYYTYSWFKGNLKSLNLEQLLEKDPTKVIWYAVNWMLPKNKLRDKRMKRLKIFAAWMDKYQNLNLETI